MKSKTKQGDVYNNLTVTSEPFIKKQGNTSRFFAEVTCICGNTKTVACSKLRTGEYKQCNDCSFKERSEKTKSVSQNEQMFRRLVLDRSKKHNIEVSITADDYEKFSKQACYYCGDKPKLINRFLKRKYINTELVYANGVDRLDPLKGYTLENCVSCCTSCNYAKHVLSKEEFIEKIKKIYKNHCL